MTYTAPIADMIFALEAMVGLDGLRAASTNADAETVSQVLSEAGRFAGEVLAPLNRIGDRQPSVLENGVVRTPPGFKQAYAQWIAGGWNALPFPAAHGGQDLPWAIAGAVQEMWQSANMGFGLCPLLTQGAVDLLIAHGSPEQQATYLPKMVEGSWTGSMNLTEPQAGSDVGALKTRAVREGDHYRITGQKIFITYGEHDFTDNIIHLVLARVAGAPAGSRGISLFVVPKFLVKDGALGPRNDLRCVSLEHKLGVNASPTAVMSYGDDGGATGFLVGEENRGLEYMFTMMNNARLSVGMQGVAIAERAYQQARDYARARLQSRELGAKSPDAVPIIRHPDVRRMLLAMKSRTEAARGLSYASFLALDLARLGDGAVKARAQARVDLLTPVAKAWCTDIGCTVASLGVQIHGGMGFIEETGAAQHYRDARITPIYEGTNGIQANDLVFRKLGRDDGAMNDLLSDIAALPAQLEATGDDDARRIGVQLAAGQAALAMAAGKMAALAKAEPRRAAAGAVPFLDLFGIVAGGYYLARGALVSARAPRTPAAAARLGSARFFADHILSAAPGLVHAALDGDAAVLALDEAAL